VNQALRNGGMTDAQLATLMSDFRAEVAQERSRRTKALRELDTEIGYSKQPRLDALLTMSGIIGDEAYLAGVGGRGRVAQRVAGWGRGWRWSGGGPVARRSRRWAWRWVSVRGPGGDVLLAATDIRARFFF
jgi:hypothetical protein